MPDIAALPSIRSICPAAFKPIAISRFIAIVFGELLAASALTWSLNFLLSVKHVTLAHQCVFIPHA